MQSTRSSSNTIRLTHHAENINQRHQQVGHSKNTNQSTSSKSHSCPTNWCEAKCEQKYKEMFRRSLKAWNQDTQCTGIAYTSNIHEHLTHTPYTHTPYTYTCTLHIHLTHTPYTYTLHKCWNSYLSWNMWLQRMGAKVLFSGAPDQSWLWR